MTMIGVGIGVGFGGRVVPFTPATLAPLLWVKADEGVYTDAGRTTPVTSDGQEINGRADLSGNGNHMTRLAFGGARPTWKANGVSAGVPSVAHTTDCLVTANIGPLDRRQASVFAVVKVTDRTRTVAINFAGTAGTTPNDYALGVNHYGRLGWVNVGTPLHSTVSVPYDRWCVVGAVFTDSAIRYYVNGRASTVVTAVGETTFQGLGLGSRTALFSGFEEAEVVYVNRSLTEAECTALLAYFATRFPTAVAATRTRNVVLCGNSITFGSSSGLEPFGHKACELAGIPAEDSWNLGVSGRQTPTITSQFATEVTPLYLSGLAAGANRCVIWEGTNHIAAGASAATAEAAIQAACEAARAGGWRVIVGTVCDRSSLFSGGQTKAGFQAAAATFNTWLRANYATFADALFDPANDPLLGAADASLDTTYFSDGTHLTQAGHDLVAATLATALAA